ncbi:MAG: nuclear transport factor 2 family protein [Terriglobales bacterium]
MTRFVIPFSLLLALSCAAQTAGGGVRATPAEQALISQTQAVAQAQKSKDTDSLKRLLSNDFAQVGSEGKLHDKGDVLDDAKDGLLKDYTLYNLEVLPIDENAAIVTFDAIIHQAEGDDLLAPRYQHFSDVWVKQDGQWRLRFQQATARRPID